MPVSQTFSVLSAFKFEVGSALASSSKLGGALDGLSSKAKELNEQLKISTIQWGAELSGTQFGVLGFFKNVLQASEETFDIQRRMATLITNNPKAFAEGPLQMKEALQVSEKIMKDMVKEADKFALDTWSYFSKVEGINAALFGKGVTGVNFENSRQLSRNIMLGSEMLPGLDNINIENSMLSLVMGQARRGQKLWDTLRADTKTLGGVSATQFNRLSPGKRVEKLNKAYEELLKNEDALIERTNSVSKQLVRLTNRFNGVYNIFHKLGSVLRNFAIDNLRKITKYIDDQLSDAFEKIGEVLENLVGGKSLVDLYFQLKDIATIGKSAEVSKTLAGVAFGIKELTALSLSFPKVRRLLFKGLSFIGFGFIKGAARLTVFSKTFHKVFSFLIRSIAYYAKFWAVAFTVSRIWEKAKNIGDKLDAKAFGNKLGKITTDTLGLSEALLKLAKPFIWFTDVIARLIGPLTSVNFWIESAAKALGLLVGVDINSTTEAIDLLKESLSKLGDRIIKIHSIIFAALIKTAPILGTVLGTLAGSPLGPVGALSGGVAGALAGNLIKDKTQERYGDLSFNELFKKIESEMQNAKEESKQNFVQTNVTNINKVEFRNQFSENFDADRVAVTLMNQLEEAAQNPIGSIRNNPVKTPGLSRV